MLRISSQIAQCQISAIMLCYRFVFASFLFSIVVCFPKQVCVILICCFIFFIVCFIITNMYPFYIPCYTGLVYGDNFVSNLFTTLILPELKSCFENVLKNHSIGYILSEFCNTYTNM